MGGGSERDFAWIRQDNTNLARTERQKIAQLTQETIRKGGYVADQKEQKLVSVLNMLHGTYRMAPSLGNAAVSQRGKAGSSTKIRKRGGLALPAALELRDRYGDAVSVVSAASAYHCGGGFATGGRHALEEALCTQTSLYPSLEAAREAVGGQYPYIPKDGVVVSPMVEVFRHGSDSGYEFLSQPVQLAAIISVAMFNANRNVRDAPVDMPADQAEYEAAVLAKFRSVLTAAVAAGSAAIVVPDVGCGVYGNDPAVVGRLFGEILKREFWGRIREVALVGKRAFQDAVEIAVGAESGYRQKRKANDGHWYYWEEFQNFYGASAKAKWDAATEEKRKANDGHSYTWEEFEQYYGDEAELHWRAADEL